MEQDEKTGFSFMNQPGLINIDVTGLCNKTCNYCPRSAGYPMKKNICTGNFLESLFWI